MAKRIIEAHGVDIQLMIKSIDTNSNGIIAELVFPKEKKAFDY